MKTVFFDKNSEFWISCAISVLVHVAVIAVFFACDEGPRQAPAPDAKERPALAGETPAPPAPGEDPAPARPAADAAAARPGPAVSAAPPRTRPADGAAPDAGAAETVAYVVKSGDTLFGLAREFSCTASELARLNNTDVRKLSNLKRGQTIRVPKAGAARPAK